MYLETTLSNLSGCVRSRAGDVLGMRQVKIIRCIACPLEDPTHLEIMENMCVGCKYFIMVTDDAVLCKYTGDGDRVE